MALSNIEIESFMKKYRPNTFHSVKSYDDFDPKMLHNTPFCLVVNTEPKKVQNGHWCAIFLSSSNVGVFFDSYGLEPFDRIRLFFKYNAKVTYYNQLTLQKNSYSCGYHCLFFLMQITRGVSLEQIIKRYQSFKNPDKMVIQFYKQRL